MTYLADVSRLLYAALHTKDAHGLHQKFGFTAPPTAYRERPSTHPQLHT
jgi:hypothetical protein